MAFCTSCGKELPENAQFCPSCGANFRNDNLQGMQNQTAPQSPQPVQQGPAPMQQQPIMMDVPTNLGKAIFVTLCCCLPLGVVSIIFAAQVESKLKDGDYDGAVDASNKASTWANWGIGIGVVVQILNIIVNVAAAGASY